VEFPKFKYHPDPISTGAIKESNEECECCEEARGFVNTSNLYAEEDIEFICPWCIADGSAAKKFDGMFSDDFPLQEAGVSEEVISEVCERTPGYNSWQQEVWQAHCGTACEFHGDAEKDELVKLSGEPLETFLRVEMIKPDVWKNILEHYEKGGHSAVYKFKCPECSEIVYTMDFM
jgi:uncharacterized protein CbrC (UPF0167 family)